MPRSVFVVVITIVLGALAPTTSAQLYAGHGVHHAPGPMQHRQMQMMLEEIDRVIAEGLGAGLAFAADQNGYPGPKHVLELKDRLQLTPAQEARVTALQAAMMADARPKSARLLEAEARLRRLFAEGVADEAGVRALVTEIERARTDVRLVHLLTHLETRAVLTDQQRRTYHEARWGK